MTTISRDQLRTNIALVAVKCRWAPDSSVGQKLSQWVDRAQYVSFEAYGSDETGCPLSQLDMVRDLGEGAVWYTDNYCGVFITAFDALMRAQFGPFDAPLEVTG